MAHAWPVELGTISKSITSIRTQKINHRVWSWAEARREAELAKCQILCHDCHVAKGQAPGDQAAYGASNHSAILTEDQVAAIRERVELGETVRSLSSDYPISYTQLARIADGSRWKRLSEEPDALPQAS